MSSGSVVWLTLEPPDRHGGGGARRQHFQIAELRRHTRVDVLVPLSEAELAPGRWRRWARRLTRASVPAVTATAFGDRVLSVLGDGDDGRLGVVVAHVETALAVPQVLTAAQVPVVVDLHNVYSRYERSNGRRWRAARWSRRERWVVEHADEVLVLSEQERSALPPGAPARVVPNGVDPQEWPPVTTTGEQSGLAMFGSWRHEPNRSGLVWFLDEVWPALRAEHGALATLHLYGPGDPPRADAAGVVHHGTVEQLAPSLHRHRGIVVPIVRGVGSRVKFVEGLASGVPVVSTSLGAEGYGVPADCYRQADTATAFADACSEALRGDLEEVGTTAAAVVLRDHSWQVASAGLVDALRLGPDGRTR